MTDAWIGEMRRIMRDKLEKIHVKIYQIDNARAEQPQPVRQPCKRGRLPGKEEVDDIN